MFSVDLLNMSAEMETGSTSTNGVYEVTMALKNDFAIKIKEIEHVFTQLADVTKSHDQTKQELRRTLCKTCRDNLYVLQKIPLKTYSDFEGQTEHQLLQSGSINDGKQTVQKEKDSYKRQVDKQQVEIARLRQQTECVPGTSDERLRALHDNHQKLKVKMTTLQQEHDANKKTLDHKTLALKEMEKESARLKTALGKCEEGLSTLQDNYHKLETKMKTVHEKHDQTKQTLEERTLANRKMEEEIASLKFEIASRDEELRSTKTERDTLNSQLTDAQHEKLNIQRDLEEQREKSAQTEKQLLKAKKDTESCLTTRDEELRSTKSERDKLKSQLMDAQHEKLNIQRDLAEQREKSTQTKKQLLKAKQDIQNRTESLRINEEKLQTLHDNHHKVKGAMATLQQEHDRTKQALDGTTLSNRKMVEENAQLKAQRATRDEELRSTKSERDKLNSQLKDAQHEKLNIQRDLEEQREKSAQTEKQLLKANQDIQNRTESLRINEERLQTLHDNHHKLTGAMATLQLEHDRTKQALDGTTLSNRKMEEENAQLKAERVKKPKLLDGQWRLEPRFDREYHQRVQGEIEYHWPLKHMGVAEDTLQHVNILFIGPVGAGKSSFINTVDSSLRGHVTATASAGNRDQSFTSAVRKYPIYASDNRRQLKIQLCDCRGLEDGVDITQDIKSILEGHILNNYVINTASPLKENMHAYNKHPGLEDKIHCVVYVLDAEKHSDHADIHTPFTTEDVRSQIENIQAHVDQKGIPQLILLNKVDIVCESTMQTTSDVYRSSLIRQRCIDAAEFLGLPPMTVLPMRNYYMETSTTDDIGILALYNIRQMLREADTFLRVNHLEELRTAK